MMASLSNMFLILIASFPVIALVFVYGGITWEGFAAAVSHFTITALLEQELACSARLCLDARFCLPLHPMAEQPC